MKKIFLIVLLGFILFSCSEPETPIAPSDPLVLLKYNPPVLDFYGTPKKSATNIQVNDYVKVNFEITHLEYATLFVATPEGKSATFHDLLNTDYELYIPSIIDSGKYLKVESLNLKMGDNIFYIKPLVPGTFQIKLEDKTKTYHFEAPIVFNAVKIITSSTVGVDSNCGIHKWRHRDFWFKMDGGNQTFDNLLVDKNATFTYSTNYDNDSYSGDFEVNKNLKIIKTRNKCGDYPSLPNNISSITIYKTIDNQAEPIATYYDISI
ncbi:hypothetical protein ACFFU9_14470 [Mariniflexile ostreae]|uniref:DUF1735 domain-containing protein n=1 Tax=Mariniflexile ostreae TaxID=1520892 RepID=A0ABV5FEQ1_9FLAO